MTARARVSGSRAADPASRADRGRSPARRRRALRFVGPSFVLVLVFFLAPSVANVIIAFTDWSGFKEDINFNGLENLRLLDRLDILRHAVTVTVIYALVAMLAQNLVSLALATALQDTNRVNTFFRGIFFVPVLVAPLAAGFIWSAVLSIDGPFNSFLSWIAPGDFRYEWFGNSTSALIAVACVDAWKWSGLTTLVYIAGLNAIPRSVLEAAVLDGAGPWRRFWSIKFPLLAPAFTFNIVVTLVGALSAFDVVFATTRGGPGNATTLLNVAVYRQYGNGFFGTASALGLVVTVLVIVSAVPLIAFLRRREVH